MDFPTAHPSLPMEAVPLSALRHGVAFRTTRLPLSPHCNPFSVLLRFDSLGDFHHSLSISLASFADRVSKGDRGQLLRPERNSRVDPSSTRPTQGRLRLHTALRHLVDAPHCRFIICFVRGPEIPQREYVRAQEQVSTETGSG